MTLTRRKFLQKSAATAAAIAFWKAGRAQAEAAPLTAPSLAPGPFQPSWDSLAQYQCPDWFRDAKFGIWAHWDPQCVPEVDGFWYGRTMYEEGSDDYNFQCAHYGHPSKAGFKDVCYRWHAENWDPEHLMGLYKAAGAKYFMALAQHHDNFDCWDSQFQPWNSVALGPKKDLVGTWAKVARAHGLRVGVSCHGSRAWNWYETSQGGDTHGPLAGVPYDGHLTKADGTGTWWEGLDPQDLYAQNHKPMGGDFDHWTTSTPGNLPNRPYLEKFVNRINDLVDQFHPDLLYFDDDTMPLYGVDPSVGLRIAAHYYNTTLQATGGRIQGVMNCKQLTDDQQRCLIMDYERGQSEVIRPHPWQTDTCIGNWHYQRSVYENHQYKTPDQVVKMLLDIVSKNGNLMLNIPVKGDGTIDSDETAFLQGMAAWMSVNSEAIFATRPWKLYGEGVVKLNSGSYHESVRPFTAKDFRFTTKGSVLYATALAWPEDGKLTVRVLASNAPGIVGKVRRVSLLGSPDTLTFAQTADGLEVTLPAQKPCDHAYVLKIEGLDLAASQPVPPPLPVIHAGADGTFTLTPDAAVTTGSALAQGGAVPNIGYWDNPKDTAAWNVHFDTPGTYTVAAKATAANGDTAFVADAGAGASAPIAVAKTAGWYDYEAIEGSLKVAAAGDCIVTVRPADPATWKPMNLAAVTLTRTEDSY